MVRLLLSIRPPAAKETSALAAPIPLVAPPLAVPTRNWRTERKRQQRPERLRSASGSTSPAFAGALAAIGWTRIGSKTRVKYSVENQKAILKNTLRTTDAEKTGSRAVI